MFWTNAGIQEVLLDADFIEITKNYKVRVLFPEDKSEQSFKNLLEVINEEYRFLEIKLTKNKNEMIILNPGAKNEAMEIKNQKIEEDIDFPKESTEETSEHPFSKLVNLLIEKEEIDKFEKLLYKEKKEIDRIFNNFIGVTINDWQKDYAEILYNSLKDEKSKYKEINKILEEILQKEEKTEIEINPELSLILKETDINGLQIFKIS